MTATSTRNIIRDYATRHSVKYRITKSGEVHFYGQMPNTNTTGWYLMDQSADDMANAISAGRI